MNLLSISASVANHQSTHVVVKETNVVLCPFFLFDQRVFSGIGRQAIQFDNFGRYQNRGKLEGRVRMRGEMAVRL